METHIAILEEITSKMANVCLHSFPWNVNTINEIYNIGDDSMAELKVIYGNTNARDFCVKEEKQSYIQMDEIMKRLFSLQNKVPIIDFLNAVYKDNISYSAKITYGNREITSLDKEKIKFISFYADMYIRVEDDERVLEYEIEFQTVYDNSMAIRMFRYGFERAVRLADFKNMGDTITMNLPEPYLIVLEEDNKTPDEIKLKIVIPKDNEFVYKTNVLKYWKYDLDRLYKENMYLLYPLQIFKLRKEMQYISSLSKPFEDKKKRMKIIYERLKIIIKNTLKYIDKAYENGKINIRDYDEMTTIIENINSYFLDMYGKYENIDEEVRNMVKSFYDPKVEERGIEKGIEKGKIEVARNLLKMGMDLLAIVQATGLSKEEIKKIEADMN
ncbi:hypothetical protein [Clostridium cochlearium]|uniref:hypothetical protein n=2 Tax=Clostridium cochlearium TaxID=1494 RepID=UPI002149A12E|nr:hypothetical protein [Clostridium cochlearium]